MALQGSYIYCTEHSVLTWMPALTLVIDAVEKIILGIKQWTRFM